MVKCSGYTFQCIDESGDLSMDVVGFTRYSDQCSIDSECKFVVTRNKGSEFENKHKIDDTSNYYNVWKKQTMKQGR